MNWARRQKSTWKRIRKDRRQGAQLYERESLRKSGSQSIALVPLGSVGAEISKFHFRRKRNLEIPKNADPGGAHRSYEAPKTALPRMPLDAPTRWLRLPVAISKSRQQSGCEGGFGLTSNRETSKCPKASKSPSCHLSHPLKIRRAQIYGRTAISTFSGISRFREIS